MDTTSIKGSAINSLFKLKLAQLFYRLEDFKQSKILYHEVIEINYTILEAYIELARIALKEKKLDDFNKYLEFPKEVLDGLYRSKETNETNGYLKQNDIRFWNKLKNLKNKLTQLEKQAQKIFN